MPFNGAERNWRNHDHNEVEELAHVSKFVASCTPVVPTQFAEHDRALAGARILKGVISAGYSHPIPSQPMAKNVLKRNKKRADAIPNPLLGWLFITASITIHRDIPTAPKSIKCRLPNLSMVNTAIQDARKYSATL